MARRDNRNGPQPSGVTRSYSSSYTDDMLLFDELPPAIREAFNYFPAKHGVATALEALPLIGEAELLRQMTLHAARYGRDFFETEARNARQ